MGTHLIPREVDGEARILLIFTPKGFFGILISLIPGVMLQQLFSALGANIIGWIAMGICAVIGFIIGQMKMPESRAFDIFRKTGGEYVKDVIARYLKFKKTRKYYVYDSEVKSSNK